MRRARDRRVASQATRRRRLLKQRTPWRGRILAYGTAGIAAALTLVFAPPWLSGTTRSVSAYDVAACVVIAIFWLFAMDSDPGGTAARAALKDPGRNAVLAIILASVAFGLAAAIVILGKGPHVTKTNEKAVIYAVGIIAVIAGWALIHTIFVFRYAHLYYFDSDDDGSAQRGLIFPGTTDPNDYDFAYFSFVIGMTFQVSDVEIKDSGVRRIALFHALISFAYNTTIVALVINIISGLFH